MDASKEIAENSGPIEYSGERDGIEVDLIPADPSMIETFGTYAHLKLREPAGMVSLDMNLDFDDILGLHAVLDEIIRKQIR